MTKGKMNLLTLIAAIVLTSAAGQKALADVADFETPDLAAETHWGGAGSGETGFTSGDAYFPHDSESYGWQGFAYSNETDITTAGYTNQFSAYAIGSEANQYGICYVPNDWMAGTYDQIPQTVSFGAVTGHDYNTTISGMLVTNTAYAYLAMRDGNSPSKKFGGASGNDEDWFKLTVKGITESGYTANDVEFYLADFRFADNSQDYIIDQWSWVDLTSLGNVVGLEFSLTSSDTGSWGINTPSYFAMDNINGVPEPATIGLLALGIAGLLRRRKN